MRLLVNLIFIILFFIFLNNIFNSLIPAYKIFLNSTKQKNETRNELLKTKEIEKQIKFLQSEQVADILKVKKSGYFDYFLPSKFIDYELTMFINQLFYIADFPQPNVQYFERSEFNHPDFKKAKITKLNFSITEIGNFDKIIKLINILENSSRIFIIDSIRLIPAGENKVEANLSISTYYYNQQ